MADRRLPSRPSRLLVGIGLDSDGHVRATRGDDFFLVGGTEETHGEMQERVERFRETLVKMGTDLEHASREQVLEAADESGLAE
jgi:heptaprenylglyceryl phosphate synthase